MSLRTISTHRTILRPQDEGSFASTMIFNPEEDLVIDRERWKNRREFFYACIAYCFSLGNLWRYPVIHIQNGGVFLIIYMSMIGIFGTSLLFFEVALGQYSSRGFTKVFAVCPLLEGISYAMGVYCLVICTQQNLINVDTYIYLFNSYNSRTFYSTCGHRPPDDCKINGSYKYTPIRSFYTFMVLNNLEMDFHSYWNFRNIGILAFLWGIVAVAMLRGIRASAWPSKLYFPIPLILLPTLIILSIFVKGGPEGMKYMFHLNIHDFGNIVIWTSAFKQSLITLGVGMGPMITIGSYSKFQSPAHFDCIAICVLAVIVSIMSAMVAFAGIGAEASSNGLSVKRFIEVSQLKRDTILTVLMSMLFHGMDSDVEAVIMGILYYLMMVLAGLYALLVHADTFLTAVYASYDFNLRYRMHINVITCILCCSIGALLCTQDYDKIIEGFNHYILYSLALSTIIICELTAIMYIYGLMDFCDDVEFMLGVTPNWFYKITWCIAPIVLLINIGASLYMYIKAREQLHSWILYLLWVLLFLIISPIIVIAIANIIYFSKKGTLEKVLEPREVVIESSDENLQTSSTLMRENKSEWFRPSTKPDAIKNAQSSKP